MVRNDDHRRPTRRGRSYNWGSLLVRALVPAAYGATILAGLYAPAKGFGTAAVVLLVGFIGYFLWRIRDLLTGALATDVERVEMGLLGALALSMAFQVTAASPSWYIAGYGVLFVGLATSVPFPAILVLPLASLSLFFSRPDTLWIGPFAQLEILTAAAGIVAVLEQRRRRRLEIALEKVRLDTEHMDAQGQAVSRSGPAADLSTLDNTLYEYLQQVKENAGAHGAVLAVKTAKGELYMRELVSDSHNIRDKAMLRLAGTNFQWIVENQKPLHTGSVQDPAARLGYYTGSVAIRSFLGVPVISGSQVEGVLALDSLRENAFADAHLTMLKVAAHQVATILNQIRALEKLRRESRDLRLLYELSKQINTCSTIQELLDLFLATVRSRVQPDFSALAFLDSKERLTVQAVGEPTWNDLQGRTFDPSHGLAGWVLSNRQYLHYDEGPQRARRPLFAHDIPVPEFPSLMLHPLETHGRLLGILCLGSRSPRSFDQQSLIFCEMLVHQGAQAVQQLRSLEQLTELAATDGLTGLANRRAFLEQLTAEITKSRRYGHGVTVLSLDIDHFKAVNDTHGHSAGDEVLRSVARALTAFARESDYVCRYGGEEFVVLLPNSDERGARALAERLRAGIAALSVEWEGKAIRTSVSIGVADLKEADTAEVLLSRSDQALYAAKERGRNCVITYSDLKQLSAR